MERQFSGKSFRKSEIVNNLQRKASFSVRNGIREMPLPFPRIVPFPGPFLQDRVNIRDGMPCSKLQALFSSGWSLNSGNRLPLWSDHSIRIIWLNGKNLKCLHGAESRLGLKLPIKLFKSC